MSRRGRGRPSKLTPEIIETIGRALRGGAYLETCADLVGVSRLTIRNWIKIGREEIESVESRSRERIRKSKALYVDFFNMVNKALAEAEIQASAIVLSAAAGWVTEKEKTTIKTDAAGNILEQSTTTETHKRRDWRAALEFLDRRFPERWAKIDRERAIEQQTAGEQLEPVEWIFEIPEPSE